MTWYPKLALYMQFQELYIL